MLPSGGTGWTERPSRLQGDPCQWSQTGEENRPDGLFLEQQEVLTWYWSTAAVGRPD